MERDVRNTASGGQPKTLVILCQGLHALGDGLDLAELCQWLQEDPAVKAEVAADLCQRPAVASSLAASGAVRLVLGLCSGGYAEVDMEAHVREAGLDPLGVERVNLGGYCALAYPSPQATDKAKALLAAAVARARAFLGSKPENVRPYLVRGQQKASRRAFFTLPPIRYQPVASIQLERCASEAGCQLCVEVCPRDALAKNDGRVFLDKSRCQACGLCVVECPRMAVELPTASLPQLEAEMTALLQTLALPPSASRAILFVCQRNAAVLEGLAKKGFSYPVGWLPLHVPCAGMVSTSWLLGCLAGGAEAVGVLACDGDCSLGQQERIEGKVAYCQELLGLLGGSPEDVRLLRPSPETVLAEVLSRPPGGDVQGRDWRPQRPSFSGRGATERAIRTLAERYGASPDISVAHSFSPLGLVRIDEDKCTACGNCARACPTGALTLRQEDGTVSLDFDPALCTACRQCIDWCPEAAGQAMRVDKVTDLQALSQGRVTLYQDRDVRCDRCGASIGPVAMLRRIETLLTCEGDANVATIATITRRCPSCRVVGVSGSRLFPGP